jgi:hypothetical protein
VAFCLTTLDTCYADFILLSAIILNAIMPSVVMFIVIVISVVAPFTCHLAARLFRIRKSNLDNSIRLEVLPFPVFRRYVMLFERHDIWHNDTQQNNAWCFLEGSALIKISCGLNARTFSIMTHDVSWCAECHLRGVTRLNYSHPCNGFIYHVVEIPRHLA